MNFPQHIGIHLDKYDRHSYTSVLPSSHFLSLPSFFKFPPFPLPLCLFSVHCRLSLSAFSLSPLSGRIMYNVREVRWRGERYRLCYLILRESRCKIRSCVLHMTICPTSNVCFFLLSLVVYMGGKRRRMFPWFCLYTHAIVSQSVSPMSLLVHSFISLPPPSSLTLEFLFVH